MLDDEDKIHNGPQYTLLFKTILLYVFSCPVDNLRYVQYNTARARFCYALGTRSSFHIIIIISGFLFIHDFMIGTGTT